ncbi:hypothetical protein B0H10DRAFT_1949352 [Mycena sp. CBHHK59/15]|nr:hypothetical protein B0H10DRAFT_1949352 [Mycena sp. CBHHK59/15]
MTKRGSAPPRELSGTWVPRRAECPYCEPKGALLRRTGAYAVPTLSHVHAQVLTTPQTRYGKCVQRGDPSCWGSVGAVGRGNRDVGGWWVGRIVCTDSRWRGPLRGSHLYLVPLDEEAVPIAIVVPKHQRPHTHPPPPPTKIPTQVRRLYEQAVRAYGTKNSHFQLKELKEELLRTECSNTTNVRLAPENGSTIRVRVNLRPYLLASIVHASANILCLGSRDSRQWFMDTMSSVNIVTSPLSMAKREEMILPDNMENRRLKYPRCGSHHRGACAVHPGDSHVCAMGETCVFKHANDKKVCYTARVKADPFRWPRPASISNSVRFYGEKPETSPGPDSWEKWLVKALSDFALALWYKSSSLNGPFDVHLCASVNIILLMTEWRRITDKGKNKLDIIASPSEHKKLSLELADWVSRFDQELTITDHFLSAFGDSRRRVQHAAKKGLSRDSDILRLSIDSARMVIQIALEKLYPTGNLRFAMDANFLEFLTSPEIPPTRDGGDPTRHRSPCRQLINVLGSDSVALDGRHTPALYSRFFSSLLAKHTVFPIRNDSPPTDDPSSILSLGQTSQPPLHMYIPHRTVNGEKSGGNRYEDEQPGIPDVWDPVWNIKRVARPKASRAPSPRQTSMEKSNLDLFDCCLTTPSKKRRLATSRADENTAPFAFTSSPCAPLDTPEPPNKRAKPNPPPSKTDNASGKRKPRRLATSRADENTAPFAFTSSPCAPLDTPEPPNKRAKPNPPPSKTDNASGKRKPVRTDAQKIESILDAIQEQRWSLGCFLYNIFRIKDAKGNPIHRSPAHSQMVSIFLAGRGKKTVANIITEWMAHADGRIPETSPNWDLMYSTTIPYNEIRPVRAALTAFSTQTIGKKKHPETKLCREDFGDATIPRVKLVIEREQAVTLYLCNNIAMRKPRKRDGVILERKTRPADTVIIHAIASLNFCRTDQANLLPLMRGILYFGSSAPVELMNYNSRIGNMPAPTTIRHALCSLSEVEAIATAAHGADPETAGFLFVDNCQNYHTQRDLCVGRENIMNVGMSGLYMEAPDIDVNVFNLEDKRKLIAENRRKHVTVDDLLGFLDQGDADLTGTLHFLEALVRCIPSLKSLSKEISMRFSATATISVPDGAAIVHPLACSGKKETIPVELRDGMLNLKAVHRWDSRRSMSMRTGTAPAIGARTAGRVVKKWSCLSYT